MKERISDKTKTIILLIITVLWIAFIFSNSIKNAEQSTNASNFVIKMLKAMFGDNIEFLKNIIRKLAHFAEFSVLGMLLKLVKNRFEKEKISIINIMFVGLFCALCDETIQLFSEGRSGQISDVWIDFSGILFGITAVLLINWLKNKKIQKQRSVLEENCV